MLRDCRGRDGERLASQESSRILRRPTRDSRDRRSRLAHRARTHPRACPGDGGTDEPPPARWDVGARAWASRPRPGYHSLLANAADYIVDRLDADIVLVPMERRQHDLQHSHAVLARMRGVHHASVLRGEYSSGQLLSLIGQFEFVVGMRLHFLILAALQGVPFLALPYAPKVTGFVEELGFEPPPFEGLNVGRLIALIDRAWDERGRIRDKIARALPSMQGRARENNAIAVALLRKSPPRAEVAQAPGADRKAS